MKIETEAFRAALDLAGRAVATTTPMDILRFARFKAKGGWFELAGHNLSLYAEAKGECGAGELEFCARADRLESALATAGDTIDLSIKGALVTWKSGRGRYQLSTLPVDDFPAPRRDADPVVTLEGPEVVEGLKRIVFGCASRDIRPWTFGVCIECSKKGEVTLFATDGHKMASLGLEVRSEAESQAIVHKDVVNALPEGAERVRVFRDSIEFDYPNGLLLARLVEGSFPDCRRVMGEKKSAATITVDRKALVHAIKAALPFDETGAIHFVVNDDGALIEATDRSGERAEVKLDSKSKGAADVWFLSTVISPAIQAARGEEVSLSLGSANDNASFKDGRLHCVCAPVRR